MHETPALEVTWTHIREAGGEEAWLQQELRKRGLLDEGTDTSTLTEAAKKQYKARREEERRVRRQLLRVRWKAYKRAHIVHVGVGVFYHDTPDLDKYDPAELDARRLDNELPAIKDAEALAAALSLEMPRLRWLAYHRVVDTASHYHFWRVPKRTGGERLISAPKPTLKKVQRWIAREISEKLPTHGAAHGFIPGRSTLSNARPHVGAAVLVKLDLKDFYPTITLARVKGLFRKAGYGEQVATLLALLCTEAPRQLQVVRGKPHYVAEGPRALPQGAPTSPSITNALCLRLDARLAGLARKLGFRYTRYADDLTFSFHPRKPEKVSAATPDEGGSAPGLNPGSNPGSKGEPALGVLLKAVEQIIGAEGFRLNAKKTQVLRPGNAQRVTGLVVNGVQPDTDATEFHTRGRARGPRVPRTLRRTLRAALHNHAQGRGKAGESLDQLRGWVAYLTMVDRAGAQRLREALKALESRLAQAQEDKA
ncbi:MAG: reverse transcriptase family protein [Myxococcota bacterium]